MRVSRDDERDLALSTRCIRVVIGVWSLVGTICRFRVRCALPGGTFLRSLGGAIWKDKSSGPDYVPPVALLQSMCHDCIVSQILGLQRTLLYRRRIRTTVLLRVGVQVGSSYVV